MYTARGVLDLDPRECLFVASGAVGPGRALTVQTAIHSTLQQCGLNPSPLQMRGRPGGWVSHLYAKAAVTKTMCPLRAERVPKFTSPEIPARLCAAPSLSHGKKSLLTTHQLNRRHQRYSTCMCRNGVRDQDRS